MTHCCAMLDVMHALMGLPSYGHMYVWAPDNQFLLDGLRFLWQHSTPSQ